MTLTQLNKRLKKDYVVKWVDLDSELHSLDSYFLELLKGDKRIVSTGGNKRDTAIGAMKDYITEENLWA